MTIELSTVVKQSKDQVACSLNDEVAILNRTSALYFGLDEVGSVIWQALSEPRQVRELCNVILDRFDVDEAQCHADILQLLTELNNAGLIELVQSDAQGS